MSGIFFTKLYTLSREELPALFAGENILAADMGGENVFTFRAQGKIALAIGNEANGLSDVSEKTDGGTVAIPMRGTQESLNAGVAAAVCMYALRVKIFITIKIITGENTMSGHSKWHNIQAKKGQGGRGER